MKIMLLLGITMEHTKNVPELPFFALICRCLSFIFVETYTEMWSFIVFVVCTWQQFSSNFSVVVAIIIINNMNFENLLKSMDILIYLRSHQATHNDDNIHSMKSEPHLGLFQLMWIISIFIILLLVVVLDDIFAIQFYPL